MNMGRQVFIQVVALPLLGVSGPEGTFNFHFHFNEFETQKKNPDFQLC